MRKIQLLATIVVSGAVILGGMVYLTQKQSKGQEPVVTHSKATEEADLEKTQRLLSKGKVEEALQIIQEYEDQISVRTEMGQKWLSLLIESGMKSANFGQLILLYEAYPRAFEGNEKAALMLADGYILGKRPQEYQKIRDEWRDKATEQETWIILDTDAMLLQGKRSDALRLLKSTQFEGKKDVDRLVRLALLYVVEDPKTAWDYLAEAYDLDPQNPDIITYRAKLLESLGKGSLALYEYLGAIQAAPNNLFLRDQLAEFYMRRNQVALALSVWLETLSTPSLDLIWVKALFWSKVITPVNFDWSKASPPTGSDKRFIDYLAGLPKGTFWDEEAFEKLPNAKKFLSSQQVTFWLRLLEALKQGDEKEAANLLQFNYFSQSILNPQLERALRQVISYRATGSFNYGAQALTNKAKELPEPIEKAAAKGDETFFAQLNQLADDEAINSPHEVPESIQDLLMSEDVFSAIFLVSGWLEAALQLHKMDVLPDDFPEWVAYGLTQAMRTNRSPAEAISFAIKQKKTAPLSILIGELYIADQKPEEALAVLKPFLTDTSDMGYRASWLTSVVYADKHEYDKAKEVIEAQPKLANDPLGKEALARIALLQGNADLADKLYMQLRDQSPEAMSYLARKAFAEKDWKRAQELTEQLLMMFPDSPILRDNLNKIMEEQEVPAP